MKKLLAMLAVVVCLVGVSFGVDYTTWTWNLTTSTSTFLVPDGAVLKTVDLFNNTTAYIIYEIKNSSAIVKYVGVPAQSEETINWNKSVKSWNISTSRTYISTTSPYDVGVSSVNKVGLGLLYSK